MFRRVITNRLKSGHTKGMALVHANNCDASLERVFRIKGKRVSIVVLKHAAEMLPIIR